MSKLEARNVSKQFRDSRSYEYIKVLEEVNISIESGQFVCLVGPSGCGKSTLLNILAGLDMPSNGEVLLDGKIAEYSDQGRVLVFQEGALFPWLNVRCNVEFGLKLAKVEKMKRNEIVMHYLDMMQLTKFAEAFTYQLSGGMKQRVAIARALAMDPEVLLMDEPFGALDSQTRDLLLVELQLIWAKTRKTIVFVTHNILESVCLGDKIVVLTKSPGRVKKEICITHKRPRLAEDSELSQYQGDVLKELKTEIIPVTRI